MAWQFMATFTILTLCAWCVTTEAKNPYKEIAARLVTLFFVGNIVSTLCMIWGL